VADNFFGEPTVIFIIPRGTGLMQLVSYKIKIGKRIGGLFEATGNEFVSKIKMPLSNISEDDPFSVQDQNSGPSRI